MMDDDALDRALSALPLEEPPAGLHSRIMAATVFRPQTVTLGWEVWMVLSAPHASERVTDLIARLVDAGGLGSVNTLVWLAVGISAAWWLSQLTIPARRRIESP